MEDLISKYLHNNLTPEEEKSLQGWLEHDRANRKVFENIVGHWQISNRDIEQAKGRVLSKVLSGAQENHSTKQEKHWMSHSIRIAASILIVIGLGLTWALTSDVFKNDQIEQVAFIEKEASYGEKLTVELPDGTVVKLNGGSKLLYRKVFAPDIREVRLEGEAFFDVARNEEAPFRISTKAIAVQVLGTSFNVKAYLEEEEIEVAVKTGKVEVTDTSTKHKVILNPLEKANYTAIDKALNKGFIESGESSIFGWTEHQLAFDDENLNQVLTKLSRWYAVEFNTSLNKDHQKKFTGKFKNPSLVRVMESLSFAYEFKYEINENSVTIY